MIFYSFLLTNFICIHPISKYVLRIWRIKNFWKCNCTHEVNISHYIILLSNLYYYYINYIILLYIIIYYNLTFAVLFLQAAYSGSCLIYDLLFPIAEARLYVLLYSLSCECGGVPIRYCSRLCVSTGKCHFSAFQMVFFTCMH